MGKDSSGRSFAEYLEDAPLAPDTSAKLILTGEVRRSTEGGKFVFSSPDLGTVELDVEAVVEFEPVDGGLTRITLDAGYVRDLSALRAGRSRGGLAPFVMATPHHASAAALRDQIKKAEGSAAILDVETAFIKDVWGDETIPVETLRF
jgi:hypothetical protein